MTVVDIYGYDLSISDSYLDDDCKVLYNEYSRQTTKSCKRFVEMAHEVNDYFLTSSLPEYITTELRPTKGLLIKHMMTNKDSHLNLMLSMRKLVKEEKS